MKRFLSMILVIILTMVSMSFGIIGPPSSETFNSKFVITNQTTGESKPVELQDFSAARTYDVYFSKGVYEGDWLEITYKPLLSLVPRQAKWTYGWGSPDERLPDGLTANVPVKGAPFPFSSQNTLAVACEYYEVEKPDNSTTYTMYFKNVQKGNRITVNNSDVSEVRVTYADYEEVSAGQRATVALYDIYGNLVSTGYLDALGTGTLSTKGKAGIYIVKVMMNNQVIFNQRIQVK